MSNLYDIIISNINDFNPELIYFSVGCSSGHYTNINPNQNQQYPKPIMDKFNKKKKVIILMDASLETPLKIQESESLTIIEDENKFRMLLGDDLLVFAINSYYYFEETPECVSQFPDDYSFLISLVTHALQNKKKLIVQNFSGHYIEDPYINLFDLFPHDALFQNVIFDVSNSLAVCFCDFTDFPLYYDDKDNFVQTNFNKLTVLKTINTRYFIRMYKDMIDKINHIFTRKLRVLRGEVEPNMYDTNALKRYIKKLNLIYPEISSLELTEANIQKIIIILLQDIFDALEIPSDIIGDLSRNGFKQNEVINSLMPLKQLF
jgi:hypothetical protein